MSAEIKARHQRAGFLWKLPMTKSSSEKWQKRMFIAKDGFLLYYGEKTNPNAAHFDTKPKGVIPLGGCKVEVVERGPRGNKNGLKISHPDFTAGRMLILAADNEEQQKGWLQALNDCSRVTMENALLGDSMIEKLRSSGTAAEKEKDEIMQKLQEQALALKVEQEEKLKLQANQDAVLAMAKEADERAARKEAEMAAALADMEKRRQELAVEAASIEAQVAQRNQALQSASSEYDKVQAMLAAARAAAHTSSGNSSTTTTADPSERISTMSLSPEDKAKVAAAAGLNVAELEAVERRAAQLESEKMMLEREKLALERSVRDMKHSTDAIRNQLETSEAARKRLETELHDLNNEEGDLASERQMRKRLERKLQIAEDSLKRLDGALRKSGVKMDVDVFSDVKTLLAYFEERTEEAKRDAQRIDLMKQALKAKRKYLMASARVETVAATEEVVTGNEEEAEGDDGWGDDDGFGSPKSPAKVTPVVTAPVTNAANSSSSTSNAARKESVDTDGWGSSDEDKNSEQGDTAANSNGITIVYEDEEGPLPTDWAKQTDEVGDTWYYNSVTGETSWVRPNPDGSVPASE